jgi:hypothetical protein
MCPLLSTALKVTRNKRHKDRCPLSLSLSWLHHGPHSGRLDITLTSAMSLLELRGIKPPSSNQAQTKHWDSIFPHQGRRAVCKAKLAAEAV